MSDDAPTRWDELRDAGGDPGPIFVYLRAELAAGSRPDKLGRARRRWALDRSDLAVIEVMVHHLGDNTEVWPTATRLAALTGLDIRTIQRSQKKLSGWGVIRDTGKRRGATGRVVVYEVAHPRDWSPELRVRPANCGTSAAIDHGIPTAINYGTTTGTEGGQAPSNPGSATGVNYGTSTGSNYGRGAVRNTLWEDPTRRDHPPAPPVGAPAGSPPAAGVVAGDVGAGDDLAVGYHGMPAEGTAPAEESANPTGGTVLADGSSSSAEGTATAEESSPSVADAPPANTPSAAPSDAAPRSEGRHRGKSSQPAEARAKGAKLTEADRDAIRADTTALAGWLAFGPPVIGTPLERWAELDPLERCWFRVALVRGGELIDPDLDADAYALTAWAFWRLQCLRHERGLGIAMPAEYDLFSKNKRRPTVLADLCEQRGRRAAIEHVHTVCDHADEIIAGCQGLSSPPGFDAGLFRHGAVVKRADAIRQREPEMAEAFAWDAGEPDSEFGAYV